MVVFDDLFVKSKPILFEIGIVKHPTSRIQVIHCAQLLLNTWHIWNRQKVSINYFAKNGEKVCCVYVEGEICKDIFEGKKEKAYLAEKFHIKYF